MKAEIIAVGTELLLGQIVNTNAQFLAEQCAQLGIDIYYQTVVGDNRTRLLESFKLAKSRSDLVICTGGLGPTQDDITKDMLAEFVGKSLYLHQPSMDKINALFQNRGRHMVESNKRQALMIEDGTPLHNEVGLAVGTAYTYEGTHFILLPGPPREMKPMFSDEVIPWIRKQYEELTPLFSKMLKFAGIGESTLEHQLLDLIENQEDPTIAPYAKEGEVAVRLTTRANNQMEADAKFLAVEQDITARVGEFLYASSDISLEEQLVGMLSHKGLTLSAAESCTGGLFAEMLTAIPGSSSVYKGGVICYSNEVKQNVLGVPEEVLSEHGAVSEQTAELLAEHTNRLLGTDITISITGVAGPSESEGKPVGLVYIGLKHKGKPVEVVCNMYSGNRETIRLRAVKTAYTMIWKLVKELE